MDKYYTPNIEEFHVGFEYERGYIVKYPEAEEGLKWSKTQADSFGSMQMDVDKYYFHKDRLIRVKYLDKEDIESLGFEYVGKEIVKFIPPRPVFYFMKDSISIQFDPNNRVLINRHLFKDKTIKNLLDHTYYENCFEGYIKNKSELKRILKQIGYE